MIFGGFFQLSAYNPLQIPRPCLSRFRGHGQTRDVTGISDWPVCRCTSRGPSELNRGDEQVLDRTYRDHGDRECLSNKSENLKIGQMSAPPLQRSSHCGCQAMLIDVKVIEICYAAIIMIELPNAATIFIAPSLPFRGDQAVDAHANGNASYDERFRRDFQESYTHWVFKCFGCVCF